MPASSSIGTSETSSRRDPHQRRALVCVRQRRLDRRERGLRGQGVKRQRDFDDHPAIGVGDRGLEDRRMLDPRMLEHLGDMLVRELSP